MASAVLALSVGPLVFASITDGTIGASNRYAWSENFGWIDFGLTEGNVHVTDSALSGYAWGETIGWISLNCNNTSSCGTVDYKVTNDGEGTLGGYAWSENLGWIQFAPTNGGVTIDNSGTFGGYAWGENAGWIVFNCSDEDSCAAVNYSVSTDWLPSYTRPSSSPTTTTTTTPQSGGRRGSPAQMAVRVAQARTTILARFEGKVQQSNQLATAQQNSAGELALEEGAAQEREARIAKRIAEHEAVVAQIQKGQEELQKKFDLHREERFARALALEQERAAEAQAALKEEQRALEEEQKANAEQRSERLAEGAQQEENSDGVSAPARLSSSPEVIAARRGRLYALIGDTPVIFADVPLTEWYAPYVSYVVEEKIATGYADEAGKPTGEFGVENPITYAEVLKMAMQASDQAFDLRGLPPPRNLSAKGTWAVAYIAQAEALQLSVFSPSLDVNKPATRGAVIQTLLEVLGITIGNTPASYDDVPKDHHYTNAIAAATFFGLVQGDLDETGKPLNRFRPDDPINRAEVAKIIALAKELMK